MLEGLLHLKECADCQKCCRFDGYDIWEMPVLSRENIGNIRNILPDVAFLEKQQNVYVFRLEHRETDDMFPCPALDAATGCLLGKSKPFDCQIFPFHIMQLQNQNIITLSPLCDIMMQKSIRQLLDFLRDGVAAQLFAYARQYPYVIRTYDTDYPILLWEHENL